MALSFNCGQYEQGFDSRRLQNWETRNRHRRRPLNKSGFTQIIANNRGHLLPSLPRSARSPWGTFVGTWDLPKKLPGNKQTDPTARSADAHIRYTGAKAEADQIIYGRTKMRRAKAGQPLEAMPTHSNCEQLMSDESQQVPSVRSGAENPMVKGTPPHRRTPVNTYVSPHLETINAMGVSPVNAMLVAATSNHITPRTPNHCSPLPLLSYSAGGRLHTPPQVGTPKPMTPMRAASCQRQTFSPVM